MVIILLPLLIAIVGLLMYAFATNGKLVEIGRLTYLCGLFWVVYVLLGQKLQI